MNYVLQNLYTPYEVFIIKEISFLNKLIHIVLANIVIHHKITIGVP
jgi:hypothetical protein